MEKFECKYCGKINLKWVKTKKGKFFLIDSDGLRHSCGYNCPACGTKFESYDQAIMCCVDKVTESLRGYGFKIYG